ncbi:hypothetical protein [Nocardia cyriacigeorgica]|uniref:hypothetical protein n=1 Tax=Nocardia cyriacigeorgica TaxID=135487 RepID=UPI0013D32060|nr:hypothetical protein [Nocardia cyriacigeorgica]NEW27259.1 hypothetical protein [Nocardia cyriacigeorgica]
MNLPDLTAEGHEIAAQECDAIADHLDRMAEIHDGSLGPYLERQHRNDAANVRARAAKHRRAAADKLAREVTHIVVV